MRTRRYFSKFARLCVWIGLLPTSDLLAASPAEVCNPLGRIPLVEYFNPTLNHFFYTQPCSQGEIAFVDSGGAGKDWRRTGWVFEVWSVAAGAPIARFYGSVKPGPNSHFYTFMYTPEYEMLIALQKATPPDQPRWNSEGNGNFSSYPSGPGNPCSPSVRRFYNQGFENKRDANHRFILNTETDLITQMKAQGWKDEGDAFCVGGAWLNGESR